MGAWGADNGGGLEREEIQKVIYKFVCPKCGGVRESDYLKHGDIPCGRCKGKMELASEDGYKDSSKQENEDPLGL